MREILFKAKRIDNGEWVEGSLLQTTAVSLKSFIVESACYTLGQWDWNDCVQVDTDTICQYTGLTDKNGNKIWENDIVGLYSEYHQEYYCGQVEYGAFNCSCCDGVYGWHFGDEDIRKYKNYEVLGNIFDNSELLEK